MKTCPDLGAWEPYLRGDLPEEQAEPLTAHLEACDDCSTLIRQLGSHAALASKLRDAFQSRDGRPRRGDATASAARVPDWFEGYRVLREVSRTHFSIVYEAVQEGTGQHVALKVLLASAVGDEKMRLRFEREVELLAHLRHPSIVPIYDSGIAGGQYFYVMPFVTGLPPDQFAEKRNLSTHDRLLLMRDICRAVQAAHQRGVIHRDLKPSNILIDDDGQPHVLDFGLAKATAADLLRDGQTLTLETGQVLGTPAYMAPEQAAGRAVDIDVRSDVYALGVILYRTLTGRMPYPVDGGLADILQQIQRTEPKRPGAINHAFAGDVDAIALRALAKEPDRRYPSAGALADDIDRHLSGQAIDARRDSTVYVVRKFVRRHPGASAALTLVVVLSIAFGITMAVMADRLRTERDTAFEMMGFLETLFGSADPGQSTVGATPKAGDQVTVVEVLDRAPAIIDVKFSGRPRVNASLKSFLGRAYRGLSQFDAAQPLLASAYGIRRRELGPEHADTINSLNDLALVTQYSGNLPEAEKLLREVLDARLRVLGRDHHDTCTSMSNLAVILAMQQETAEAEQLYRDALAGLRRLGEEEHEDTIRVISNLGTLLFRQRRVEEAVAMTRDALDLSARVLGPEQTSTLGTKQNLAVMLRDLGQLDEAERITRETLASRSRLLGDAYPDTLLSHDHLARILTAAGKLDEAEREFRRLLGLATGVLAAWHVARIESDFGECLIQLGKHDEAMQALRRSWETLRASPLGENHAYSQRALKLLIDACEAGGQLDEAESLRVSLVQAPPP